MPVFRVPARMLLWEGRGRRRGLHPIAGLDEAGRGPLAGPVVAAAVILPGKRTYPVLIRDSKRLTPRRRREAFDCLIGLPGVEIGVGIVGHDEIDRINILEATRKAMALALRRLSRAPAYLLIDGLNLPAIDVPQEKLTSGEEQSVSIAAASIIAKVRRDQIMGELDRVYPEYGFVRHKGYGTREHLEMLRKHGPSPVHRFSFAPLKFSLRENFKNVR